MDTDLSSLARYVRERLAELGMSQTQLAERASLSKSDINGVVQGRIKLPGAEKRRELAKALGVSHLDLLIAAGEIRPEEIRAAGAEGVIDRPDDPLTEGLIERVRSIQWESRPDLAEGITRILADVQRDHGRGSRSRE